MWWLYLSVVVIVLLKLYFQNVYSYWQKRGVPTPDYKLLVGNMGSVVILRKSMGQLFTEAYKKFEGKNYFGMYQFTRPMVVVRNPEIVKDVLSKSFSSFHDNDIYVDADADLILGKNPFFLKGEEWKRMRAQMTPNFSSSKLKSMVPLILDSVQKMCTYLDQDPNATNQVGLDAKELCYKYTCENIASCAFGLDGHSFTDPNPEFRDNGKKLMDMNIWNQIKVMIMFTVPSLAKKMSMKFTPDDITNFFRNIVAKTIEYRISNNVRRNDFLDVMTDLKAKINDEKLFNYDDITAHAGGFFIDGFETSSIAISYALYELAANPDVQEKLRNEIDDVLEKNGGEFSYEGVLEMEYMDCVFKESLRKNPPAMNLTKLCTEAFKLPPINDDDTGCSITVDVGMTVIIPIDALHTDGKHYPEPTRFMPERFDENGKNIVKGAYLPFGDGPRMCLGQKFASLQSKLAIAAIVRKYELKVNRKTKEPLEIDCSSFMRTPLGGIWLNFVKRK